MAMWMPGQTGRRIFAVEAPANHAGREALPPAFAEIPMPTVLVRSKANLAPSICGRV